MNNTNSEKVMIVKGIVTEALPNTLFRVNIEEKTESAEENRKEIFAYLGGKMRIHRIKVLIGDKVEVVLDPYGGKGRIVKRL